MQSVLVISHGSHSKQTIKEVRALTTLLKEKSKRPIVDYAFLEIASPSIPEGIDACVKKGADEIVILLNFLNSGRHVDQDIPRIVSQARRKHPKVKIRVTNPVGQHPRIVELFRELIESKARRGKSGSSGKW